MKKSWVIVCLILFICFCKQSPRESSLQNSKDFALPARVILSFDIYNHTQGFLKNFSRKVRAEENLKISIQDLDVNGVDERRIVIREGLLGPRLAYSRTGECEFVTPDKDSQLIIYLMNASNEAEYRAVDVWVGIYEGNLQFPRKMKWFLENRDGYQGPEYPIVAAISQLNEALSFPWIKYGQFDQVFIESDSDFSVGYGYCEDEYGIHTLKWAGVNPDHCPTEKFKQETFLEEIFELVTSTENIAEKDSASMIANPDTGALNEKGRDLLAYIFVKDVK